MLTFFLGFSLLALPPMAASEDQDKLENSNQQSGSLNGKPISSHPQQEVLSIPLTAEAILVTAEIAATPLKREIGLSHRTAIPNHQGMLFVWPTSNRYCLWMKDTPLPLTALFLSDHGEILGITEMNPNTLDRHCAPEPVRFILEVRQDWKGRGIVSTGSKLGGIDQAPSSR